MEFPHNHSMIPLGTQPINTKSPFNPKRVATPSPIQDSVGVVNDEHSIPYHPKTESAYSIFQ